MKLSIAFAVLTVALAGCVTPMYLDLTLKDRDGDGVVQIGVEGRCADEVAKGVREELERVLPGMLLKHAEDSRPRLTPELIKELSAQFFFELAYRYISSQYFNSARVCLEIVLRDYPNSIYARTAKRILVKLLEFEGAEVY